MQAWHAVGHAVSWLSVHDAPAPPCPAVAMNAIAICLVDAGMQLGIAACMSIHGIRSTMHEHHLPTMIGANMQPSSASLPRKPSSLVSFASKLLSHCSSYTVALVRRKPDRAGLISRLVRFCQYPHQHFFRGGQPGLGSIDGPSVETAVQAGNRHAHTGSGKLKPSPFLSPFVEIAQSRRGMRLHEPTLAHAGRADESFIFGPEVKEGWYYVPRRQRIKNVQVGQG
eukprot:571843-Pelagomonas_calceolata.AAC.1